MKKLLFLPLLLLFMVSCASSIPFNKNYAGKEIKAVLYVADLPEPFVNIPGLTKLIHGDDIKKAFIAYAPQGKQYSIDTVAASNFAKNPKFTIVPDANFQSKTLPLSKHTDQQLLDNINLMRYDFSQMSEKPAYILEYRVLAWGETQIGAFGVGITAALEFTLYDTEKNAKVWMYRTNSIQGNFPGLAPAWKDGKEVGNIEIAYKELLQKFLEQSMKDIQKP